MKQFDMSQTIQHFDHKEYYDLILAIANTPGIVNTLGFKLSIKLQVVFTDWTKTF